MAKYASIKVRPKNENSPNIGTVLHNQRYVKPDDLLPEEYRLPNYHLTPVTNVTKTVNDWVVENEKRYQSTHNRKLRSDARRLESLVIVLSGEQVEKCSPTEIWQNAIVFKEWFEERYKTKVRTVDWHRDEGRIEDDKVIRNDHIHLEFDNVNADGKMVRRLFSKGDLINFQDKIAEIYKPLGFIRGEDTVKKHRHDTPKRGLGQKKWKNKKKSEALATKADLTKEVKALKARLQVRGAEQPEHAKIDELSRQLKEEQKAKKLTKEALTQALKEAERNLTFPKPIYGDRNELIDYELVPYKQGYQEQKEKNKELEEEVEGLEEELEEVKKSFKTQAREQDELIEDLSDQIDKYKLLPSENQELEKAHASIKEMSILLESMTKQKEKLADRNDLLEYNSGVDFETIKELKNEVKALKVKSNTKVNHISIKR